MIDYKVRLGRIARTVYFEDTKGEIRFTFDGDSFKKPQVIIIECGKAEKEQQARIRQEFALEKVKEYFHSRGFDVEVFDGGFNLPKGQPPQL